ncbi:hypothetical protein HDU86_000113 [Geranomyces michiganensis]|nr:hypothetical protein HDU86_000113 [Geranomyces michiganensis]
MLFSISQPLLRAPLPLLALARLRLSCHRDIQTAVNTVKKNAIVSHRDRIWLVHGITHHTKGRGGAHYKFELREVVGGGKLLERFNSGSFVEVLELETKELQYLYHAEDLHLIDPETYEEHVLPMSRFTGGDKAIPFLRPSNTLRVDFHAAQPLVARMPDRGTYKIVSTAPAASSGTNQSSKGTNYKEAELETGARIMVPEFVGVGEDVVVDLVEYEYVSRAK